MHVDLKIFSTTFCVNFRSNGVNVVECRIMWNSTPNHIHRQDDMRSIRFNTFRKIVLYVWLSQHLVSFKSHWYSNDCNVGIYILDCNKNETFTCISILVLYRLQLKWTALNVPKVWLWRCEWSSPHTHTHTNRTPYDHTSKAKKNAQHSHFTCTIHVSPNKYHIALPHLRRFQSPIKSNLNP